MKRQLIAAYGAPGRTSGYQLDHLVPLELGGAPNDPRNLWPEPLADAHVKDVRESVLHGDLCDGRITLAAAQAEMTRWHR